MLSQEQKISWKSRLKTILFEFYTSSLMQNQLSFSIWTIFYLISYFQLLDFVFHSFTDTVSNQSFAASFILQLFSAVSVLLWTKHFLGSHVYIDRHAVRWNICCGNCASALPDNRVRFLPRDLQSNVKDDSDDREILRTILSLLDSTDHEHDLLLSNHNILSGVLWSKDKW